MQITGNIKVTLENIFPVLYYKKKSRIKQIVSTLWWPPRTVAPPWRIITIGYAFVPKTLKETDNRPALASTTKANQKIAPC